MKNDGERKLGMQKQPSQEAFFDTLIELHGSSANKIEMLLGENFDECLKLFPPHLQQIKSAKALNEIFRCAYHVASESILVCNSGASLFTKSPLSRTPACVFHLGFAVMKRGHGCETANVGIYGSAASSEFFVVRAESACAPSFIFGSQRCNCAEQWLVSREVASVENSFVFDALNPDQLEKSVREYFSSNGASLPATKGNGQCYILVHLDAQNGMGSGATEQVYMPDLYATAFIRHRGEYTSEQLYQTTVAGGFQSIGLIPDPRQLNDGYGYRVPAIILDYLAVDKPIVLLTNNAQKVQAFEGLGFKVMRHGVVGRTDIGCQLETRDRRAEFGHSINEHEEMSIEEEARLLAWEIASMRSG